MDSDVFVHENTTLRYVVTRAIFLPTASIYDSIHDETSQWRSGL